MSSGNTLSRLFGKSPFLPLQTHMRVVLECAREIQPLIEALARGDEERVIKAKDHIFEREAEADRIKNELRLQLPRSLFMPVDRRDLLEVLHMQDAIANTAQDVAGLLIERQMTIPDFMHDPLIALTSAVSIPASIRPVSSKNWTNCWPSVFAAARQTRSIKC